MSLQQHTNTIWATQFAPQWSITHAVIAGEHMLEYSGIGDLSEAGISWRRSEIPIYGHACARHVDAVSSRSTFPTVRCTAPCCYAFEETPVRHDLLHIDRSSKSLANCSQFAPRGKGCHLFMGLPLPRASCYYWSGRKTLTSRVM